VTRRIVRELPDEPQLEGRRITVQFVKTQVEDRGLEPRTVAGRHDIDVTDVYRALTYYHDHASSPRLDSLERGASTLLAHDVFRDAQWIRSARQWGVAGSRPPGYAVLPTTPQFYTRTALSISSIADGTGVRDTEAVCTSRALLRRWVIRRPLGTKQESGPSTLVADRFRTRTDAHPRTPGAFVVTIVVRCYSPSSF
jgi:uncharacterized protein (DUF433 family)